MRVLKKGKKNNNIKSICNRLEKQEITKERIRVLEQKWTIIRSNQKIKKGRGFFLAKLEFF